LPCLLVIFAVWFTSRVVPGFVSGVSPHAGIDPHFTGSLVELARPGERDRLDPIGESRSANVLRGRRTFGGLDLVMAPVVALLVDLPRRRHRGRRDRRRRPRRPRLGRRLDLAPSLLRRVGPIDPARPIPRLPADSIENPPLLDPPSKARPLGQFSLPRRSTPHRCRRPDRRGVRPWAVSPLRPCSSLIASDRSRPWPAPSSG
jgi:hypothetical protein